jgi:uncharacterized protein YndB with AHSA1/START domain
MTDGRKLVSKVRIRATAERVWRELTKTDEPQAAVFNAWLHAQAMLPGAMIQMRTIDGRNVLVIGRIVEFDPPRRFAHTFRFTQYDDPECTVIYDIATVGSEVDVTLTVDSIPVNTRTAKDMVSGATMILETLKSVAETGRPKPGTRFMYALFARLGFVLPKRTRAEHWPLTSTENPK